MHEAAASCKHIAPAPVTNWEPHDVTLAGYCHAVRRWMKFQLVNSVSSESLVTLQRYGTR